MTTRNFDQEQLSWAYLRAVIYDASYRLYVPEVDDHRIDGSIKSPGGGINQVDFQLKSTTRYEVRDEAIHYDLRVENYNALILDDDLPRILVLYLMPADESEWLAQSEDELCLRKCAYWVSLMGNPRSTNASTERIAIPLENVFDSVGLDSVFRLTLK